MNRRRSLTERPSGPKVCDRRAAETTQEAYSEYSKLSVPYGEAKALSSTHLIDALGVRVHRGYVLTEESKRLVPPLLVLDLQDLRMASSTLAQAFAKEDR